jgi:Uma2 family endonuclease
MAMLACRRMLAGHLPHVTPRRLTRIEYERIAQLGLFAGERVELIRGIVVRRPSIGPQHSEAVDRLGRLFVERLGRSARVRIQQPWLAHDESEPEPDIALVPEENYSARHPDRAFLIVEVAQSSLDYDRETKAPLYAESEVPELWIVDIAGKAVEVHDQPVAGRYTRVRRIVEGKTLQAAALPDIALDLSELLSGISS